MITFHAVLKTNYKRALTRIVPFTVITLISMASIIFAAYLSNKVQTFAHIAVIGEAPALADYTDSPRIKITRLKEAPPLSDLYEQKYDAYLSLDNEGRVQIQTLKSVEYKNLLLALLNNPATPIEGNYKSKSPGETIVGFMLMFLLMISFQNMTYFADDKEQGQLRRIFTAPASFFWYVLANVVYSLSMFTPQFLLLAFMKILGIHVGFTLPEFLMFILVIGFLGSSFALLLHTLIPKPDNANMLGSSITVLSSILSGAFYSFSKNNELLDNIIKIIPQKQILNFAENIGSIYHISDIFPIGYVLFISLIFFVISCVFLQKKYVKST